MSGLAGPHHERRQLADLLGGSRVEILQPRARVTQSGNVAARDRVTQRIARGGERVRFIATAAQFDQQRGCEQRRNRAGGSTRCALRRLAYGEAPRERLRSCESPTSAKTPGPNSASAVGSGTLKVRETSLPIRKIVPVVGLPRVVAGGIETGIVPPTFAAPGVFRLASVIVKPDPPGGGGFVPMIETGKFPSRLQKSPAQLR